MEFNVTKPIGEWEDVDSGVAARDYSCSIAEAGPTAGADSWQASVADGLDYFDLTTDETQEVKDWFAEFGAWDEEDIAKWDAQETAGLLLQLLAGYYREMKACGTYQEYKEESEKGSVSGDLFRGGGWFSDNWYLYVGN